MRGPPLAVFQLIHVPPSLHSMVAGAGAGLVSSIATCPLDVVKTTLQAQSVARGDKGYEGVTKTIIRIYRQSGLRGFYRGLGPTIGGYLPTWGIYFTVYDFIKDRLRRVPLAVAHPDMSHVVAAMTAGATGTILTNPLWVVKTRFMAQAILPPTAKRYRNTVQAFYTIYKNEGIRAFYKGLLPSLFGVSHVAVQFGLYEKSKSWAAHANVDSRVLGLLQDGGLARDISPRSTAYAYPSATQPPSRSAASDRAARTDRLGTHRRTSGLVDARVTRDAVLAPRDGLGATIPREDRAAALGQREITEMAAQAGRDHRRMPTHLPPGRVARVLPRAQHQPRAHRAKLGRHHAVVRAHYAQSSIVLLMNASCYISAVGWTDVTSGFWRVDDRQPFLTQLRLPPLCCLLTALAIPRSRSTIHFHSMHKVPAAASAGSRPSRNVKSTPTRVDARRGFSIAEYLARAGRRKNDSARPRKLLQPT
ncbi:unnamed protein product [Cutaneotrichosporon oleaginosum]